MRRILRHAAPGVILVLLAMLAWWSPLVLLVTLIATMPAALRRSWRARAAAELRAAKALYFGAWHDRIDPVWLPQDVKAFLAARPKLLSRQRPKAAAQIEGR